MGATLADTGAFLPSPDNFYNGEYSYGPTIDYRGVLDFFADNPSQIALDEVATAFNELSIDYGIKEKIYAGYAMVSGDLGDLTAVGGVRVEHTKGRYDAFAIRDTDGNGVLEASDIAPLSFEKEYTNFLPSVHLNRPGIAGGHLV